MFFKILRKDIKFITGRPVYLFSILIPFLLVLLLKLFIPLITGISAYYLSFQIVPYYALISMTIISSVPFVTGFILAKVNANDHYLQIPVDIEQQGKVRKIIFFKIVESALISFLFVVTTMLLTNPVPTEGLIRTIYAGILLSLHTPHVLLSIVNMDNHKVKPVFIYLIWIYFILAIPFGLLISAPWNYISFISPLYWTCWAWITPIIWQSVFSGIIPLVLIFGAIIPLIIVMLKRQAR